MQQKKKKSPIRPSAFLQNFETGSSHNYLFLKRLKIDNSSPCQDFFLEFVVMFTYTHDWHEYRVNLGAFNYFFKLFFFQHGTIVHYPSLMTLKRRTGWIFSNLHQSMHSDSNIHIYTSTNIRLNVP